MPDNTIDLAGLGPRPRSPTAGSRVQHPHRPFDQILDLVHRHPASCRDIMRYQTYPKPRELLCWHTTESACRFAPIRPRVKNARKHESDCPPEHNAQYGADGDDWRNSGGTAVGGNCCHRPGSARRCGRGHGVGSEFPPCGPDGRRGGRTAAGEHGVRARELAAPTLKRRTQVAGPSAQQSIHRLGSPPVICQQIAVYRALGPPGTCSPGSLSVQERCAATRWAPARRRHRQFPERTEVQQ